MSTQEGVQPEPGDVDERTPGARHQRAAPAAAAQPASAAQQPMAQPAAAAQQPTAQPVAAGSLPPAAESQPPADAPPALQPADDIITIDPRMVRRAPRYRRFALAGVVVGATVALVLAVFVANHETLDAKGMFLILAAVLAPLGALIACLGAVLGESRRTPRIDS